VSLKEFAKHDVGISGNAPATDHGNYVVHDQPVTDPLQIDVLNQFLAQIESAANNPYVRRSSRTRKR
jgi:hypothetical protein